MADRENYDPDAPRRCTGRTRTGARCSKRAVNGTDRCAHHTFRIPGRPRKVSPQLTEQVVDVLLDGNYIETAAAIVGIGKSTLYRWLRHAEDLEAKALELVDDDEPTPDIYRHVDPRDWPLLDFRHAVKSAEAYAEAELVRNVRRAGLGWQAFATILERRHPDRWGRRKTFDHTTGDSVTGRGRLELVVPPDEDRRRAVAELLSATGALDEDEDAVEQRRERRDRFGQPFDLDDELVAIELQVERTERGDRQGYISVSADVLRAMLDELNGRRP